MKNSNQSLSASSVENARNLSIPDQSDIRSQAQAANNICDELVLILGDARLAHFSICELLNGHFDLDDHGSNEEFREKLLVTYEAGLHQAEIALHFIFRVVQALEAAVE